MTSTPAELVPATLPALRTWSPGVGRCLLGSPGVIGHSGDDAADVAELLADDLRLFRGARPVIDSDPATAEIRLIMDPRLTGELGPEGYWLEIADGVEIRAAGRSGLLYGCQTVGQLIKQDPERRSLPCGRTVDRPRCAVRGQMIDVGRKFLPLTYLRSEIRRMAWLKLNSLQLHLTEWNGFRFESLEFPGLASADHYTQDELRDLDAYAARWGVTIVPELDLPGHAVWLTRYEPRLRLRSPAMDYAGWPGGLGGGWTLDLTSEFARDVVRRLIIELAGLFRGEYVHIGGDEIPLQTAEKQDPALLAYAQSKGLRYSGDALIDFANDLAATLHEHGKRAELWEWWNYGDQPASIAPAADIRISKWLDGDPAELTRRGYRTVGVNWGGNYVTPGYSTTPTGTSPQGFEGHMPAERIYADDDYPCDDLLEGHRLGRWMDKSEARSTSWVHFFSHRPLQVLADRTWGGPAAASATDFYARADAIGAADDERTAVLVRECRVVEASSEELKDEDGSVQHLLDPDPQTQWVTQYRDDLMITPHHVVIDTGAARPLAGIEVWPRQDGKVVENFHHTKARPKAIRVEVSTDRRTWRPAWSGILPDEQPAHAVRFPEISGRYLKLIIDSDWDNLFITAVAYLSILQTRRA
ncbi:family 20 glycosylhydrolase [Microlunatus sp. GCM10028923]|uniref:family 20 glycosylhydrolase n=1 Tax=Microlunatus sp. GCM10028923 TaxID=3273400 RepID=UPI00360C7FE5